VKKIIIAVFIFISSISKSQNNIEWDGIYQLQLSDFQSPATQIGNATIQSITAACGFNFMFHMSNAEFMFTKNFNSKINCTFKRSSSAIVAPDSVAALDLLSFARFDFDLSELYARKFRQKLFESKGVFSDVSFCMPLYDSIQTAFTERSTNAGKESNYGTKILILLELQQQVNTELMELADFCKTCKPSKKKKDNE
jgi:hypothetical protein